MVTLRQCQISLLLVFLGLACATHAPHQQREVEAAMQQYDRYILSVDVDSMALLFTKDGNLGNIARGQDSIRRFLAKFKSVRVLSMASTTDAIVLTGDSSTQRGSYRQTAVLSARDTVRVNGDYVARWQWFPKQGWRLKSMQTTPKQ